ncbi:bifunctional 3'-5' exonuclease/DNA polymerase [Streptomyces mirabilis]|nr:bifunctional 3'-5' exonuclease/DNA polymerase [Streptomyces mirabilis]
MRGDPTWSGGSGGPRPRSIRVCSPRGCEWSGVTTSRRPRHCCSATRAGSANPGRRPPRWRDCAAAPCRRIPAALRRARLAVVPLRAAPGPRTPGDLLAVYADQRRRHDTTAHPERMHLLTTAESAGMLVAAEMNRTGLPWRADVHREVLHELLGERYAGGGEPRRLAELTDEVSAAFGERVRPDLPADVIKAFAQAGIKIKSTRRWEIETIEHPAVKPLLEYKKLYRIWVAHGWSWLQDWVRDGRFRPEYLPGGTVTGRWVTNGGGALQIPKVIRRAVVADPGWRLVVADADQMEPRVLAAISRDPGLMEVAGRESDLYQSVSDRAFAGDRAQAKLAVLGAVYGQTSGDGLKNLAALRGRFPAPSPTWTTRRGPARRADSYGRGWGGRGPRRPARPTPRRRRRACLRTNPPSPSETRAGCRATPPPTPAPGAASRTSFVVQGSAADWALLLLAALRRTCADLAAELVFFQHDEVMVHCPAEEADAVVAAIREAAELAGRLTFGETPVRFPFTTAVVECYADAK